MDNQVSGPEGSVLKENTGKAGRAFSVQVKT